MVENILNKSGEKTRAIGAAEYRKFIAGEELSAGEMIRAKCYECTAKYADGREDCQGTNCPLYGKMPYASTTEKHRKIMPKSCARCEFPVREDGSYKCSIDNPQEDREGRLFPCDESCWRGRKVRGGKGDTI